MICTERFGIGQQRGERILVTTLTKRMAEDLSDYYTDLGLAVRYLHSDIHTMERMDIIRDLRVGKFDALIGINLLREGLDIPEVSLAAILDADKEGFLRSTRSLIQTFGRAARNINGTVILYADRMTASMKAGHRRNRATAVYPAAIQPNPSDHPANRSQGHYGCFRQGISIIGSRIDAGRRGAGGIRSGENIESAIRDLEAQMQAAAKELAFEQAARIRDRIKALRKRMLFES
jgi:excinuclease ABC subunit B